MSGLSTAQLQQFADGGLSRRRERARPGAGFRAGDGRVRAILDGIADRLYADGAISSTYADLPFAARVTEICAESRQVLSQYFDFSLPQTGVRPDTPIYAGPAMFRVLTNPRLLDVVESVIGPEIFSCPVQHTRMKLPKRAVADPANGLIAKIPWHQDNGVLMPEADESSILTVWMPVTEATVANGCMQVIPRSHGRELFDHCPGGPGGLAIPDAVLPPGEPTPLPMKPGSILLMTQSTVHSSLDNVTPDQVRISFDLRYQPIGAADGPPRLRARRVHRPQCGAPGVCRARSGDLAAQLADGARCPGGGREPAFNRWNADAPVCA